MDYNLKHYVIALWLYTQCNRPQPVAIRRPLTKCLRLSVVMQLAYGWEQQLMGRSNNVKDSIQCRNEAYISATSSDRRRLIHVLCVK